MIKTVFLQKYKNFKVVFIDDSRDSELIQKQKQYIAEHSNGINVTEIYNDKRLFALKNRYISVADHCNDGDIVVDLDSDDSLIGVYVFQLINTMYQRYPNKWAVYFNCIAQMDKYSIGIAKSSTGDIPDKIFEANSYRTSGLWKTT